MFDKKGRSVWSTNSAQKGSRAVITDSGNFIMLDLSPGKTQMMLFYDNTVPYLSSGEWNGGYFVKEPQLAGSKKLQASCVRLSPSRIYINYVINQIDHILTGRFLVSENGRYQLYYLMDDGGWSMRWSTYQGQCSDCEICGTNGLCNANDVCSCVQGFTPKNGSKSWWSSGCARRRPLHCSVTEGTTDGFSEAKDQYLSEKEAVLYSKQTQQGCRIACLNNCSSTAFAFAISDPPVCRLWFGDLFRMRMSSEGQSVFVRLSELPHLKSEISNKTPKLTILLSAAASLFVVSALLSAILIMWKRRKMLKKDVEEEVSISLKRFSYKELRIATENFKHKLGTELSALCSKELCQTTRMLQLKD